MASTSIASGIQGVGSHSVFANQIEGFSCTRRNFQHARLAKDCLHWQHGCHMNAHFSKKRSMLSKALPEGGQPSDGDNEGDDSSSDSFYQVGKTGMSCCTMECNGGCLIFIRGENQDSFRKNLENIIGDDDGSFCGRDLAMLIRNKYGRSYDVQLIKKEFMGRQLLAMNVMWKYREQRSFPLTEEEYLLRLDDVANNLRCWGAVSYVRNSLAKTKERPRIGKAVSIFIDLDESGGRANEWIYR